MLGDGYAAAERIALEPNGNPNYTVGLRSQFIDFRIGSYDSDSGKGAMSPSLGNTGINLRPFCRLADTDNIQQQYKKATALWVWRDTNIKVWKPLNDRKRSGRRIVGALDVTQI